VAQVIALGNELNRFSRLDCTLCDCFMTFFRIKTNGSLPRDGSNKKNVHPNGHHSDQEIQSIFTFSESSHKSSASSPTSNSISFASISPDEAMSPPLFNSTANSSYTQADNARTKGPVVGLLRSATSPYENVSADPAPRLGTRVPLSHCHYRPSDSCLNGNPRRPILSNGNSSSALASDRCDSRSDSATPPKSNRSVSFANCVKEFGASDDEDDEEQKSKKGKEGIVKTIATEVEVHNTSRDEKDECIKNNSQRADPHLPPSTPSICITSSETDTRDVIKTKSSSSSSSCSTEGEESVATASRKKIPVKVR